MAITISSFKGMNNFIDKSLLDKNTASKLVNADIKTGKLVPIREPLNLGVHAITDFGHYGAWDRSVVQWYGRYYWSDNDAVAEPYYGGNVEGLGIPIPDNLPQLGLVELEEGEDGLTGRYRYCCCFVNENGWEGAPSEDVANYFSELDVTNMYITVKVPEFPEGITSAKVYRTINNGADFYLLDEVTESGGTITDRLEDTTLVLREVCTSLDNFPPPEGGKYLTENGGVFYLAVGDRLYFSILGNPHAWHPLYFIGFDDTITGICAEFQGVLVFTYNGVYRVIGAENPSSVSKVLIPSQQGCANWHTINKISNAPIWLSNDGLCIWDGNNVQIISQGVYDTSSIRARCSCSYDDCYYLFTYDNNCVVYDRRNGGVFRELGFSCDYAWYNAELDKMYLYNEVLGVAYSFGEGEVLPITFISGYYNSDSVHYQSFSNLRINATEPMSVKVFAENVQILDINVANVPMIKTIKLPSRFVMDLSLEVKTSGEIKGIYLE